MLKKYYTIQSIDAWRHAQSQGYLEGNLDYVGKDFFYAYTWMMKQMKKRLISYNDEWPVWLWLEKPDLRRGGYINPKEHGILLQVLIEEEKVLLSDFENWHCVLNDGPVAYTEEEWEEINKSNSKITKENSWERIFDLDHLDNNNTEFSFEKTIVQGVTGRICVCNIKPIKEFIGKSITF